MKRIIAALSVAFLLAQPVLAAAPANIPLPDKADTVVVPPGSGLKFSRFEGDDSAVFAGKLTLSGTFYYGDNAYNDGTGVDLTLYFKPDAASVARLPYLKTRGKAGLLVLTDAGAFATAVLSKAQRATLGKKGKPFPYATGQASITVDNFEAGVACDVATFSARYLSLAEPTTAKVASAPDAGC